MTRISAKFRFELKITIDWTKSVGKGKMDKANTNMGKRGDIPRTMTEDNVMRLTNKAHDYTKNALIRKC